MSYVTPQEMHTKLLECQDIPHSVTYTRNDKTIGIFRKNLNVPDLTITWFDNEYNEHTMFIVNPAESPNASSNPDDIVRIVKRELGLI